MLGSARCVENDVVVVPEPFDECETPALVVAVTVVHGFAFGALGTINLAVAIDQSGGRRAGAVMGWYTAALSAGYALGAFSAGAFADRIGIDATLLWLGLTPLAAMLAVWLTPAVPDVERAAPAPGVALWRRGLVGLCRRCGWLISR